MTFMFAPHFAPREEGTQESGASPTRDAEVRPINRERMAGGTPLSRHSAVDFPPALRKRLDALDKVLA